MLEAARWTASSMNNQPWRFVVARRGEPHFDVIFENLMDGNKLWAGTASALIVAGYEAGVDKPVCAAYDVGQAVAMLSVQAQAGGLFTHQIGGFHRTELVQALGIADVFKPLAIIAVGALGSVAQLSADLAERENAPRSRKPLGDLIVRVDLDRQSVGADADRREVEAS